MDTDFSSWLADILEDRGLSQANLAELSGLSTAQVSRIINRRSFPGKDAIKLIAEALNIPPSQVFKAAGDIPYEPTTTEQLDELMHLVVQLTDSDRDLLIDMARMLLDREGRHV